MRAHADHAFPPGTLPSTEAHAAAQVLVQTIEGLLPGLVERYLETRSR